MAAYKIADGYIEIHGRRDRAQIAREAQQAGQEGGQVAGRATAQAADRSAEDEGRRLRPRGGMLRALFTPDPDIMAALTRPLGAMFSTPAAALGLLFGSMFLAGAIATILTGGLAAAVVVAFAGAGALILSNNQKLIQRWEAFTKKVMPSLTRAAEPMLGTLSNAMTTTERAVLRMEPILNRIFKAIDPGVSALIVGLLGGIEQFLIDIEPHIPALVEMTAAFAAQLPTAFAALASFFGILADNKEMIITLMPAAFSVLSFAIKAVAVALIALVAVFGGFVFLHKLLHDIIMVKIPAIWRSFGANTSAFWEGFKAKLSAFWSNLWNTFWSNTTSHWSKIGSAVSSGVTRVFTFITTLGGLPAKVSGYFASLRSGAATQMNSLVSFTGGIPGRISAAVGGLGNLLRQAGRNVVQGLIDGIRSRIGALMDAANSIAGVIRDRLPFSPAKVGPLSGQGSPDIAGRKIVSMIGQGITSERGRISSALNGALNVVANVGQSAPAPAAASGGGTYTIKLGEATLAKFIIDAVTGAPEPVALAIKDHERGRAR